MKKLLLMFAAVATLFTACDKETEHIYDDHSADLVGTWSCLTANYAEVLIINADGSAVSYGVEDGEYWENVRGTVATEGGNITMNFEDNDNLTGHFDIIPNREFSLYEDSGERYVYQYCENDLADEIIGMWVSTDDSSIEEHNMFVQTFYENGKSTYTGFGEIDGEIVFKKESNYKVIGDACFQEINGKYIAWKVIFSQNGTSLGDIMSMINGGYTSTWLRVREGLNLTGKTYDYKSAYVTNAKGKDEDFTIFGNTLNIAKIKAYDFDKLFGADLYNIELNTNLFKYRLLLENGEEAGADVPMTVEGNKVTLDFSAVNPACRSVEIHMFQDADDSQLHIYMHTKAFINYFANLKVLTMPLEGNFDLSDAAVDKVFADMEARIESINVSFVMKARK
ncbi:MAG: hypothetical protein IIV55_00535 [Alistipes sp.]|nr:hypothetical protein [Alistipes sp.]